MIVVRAVVEVTGGDVVALSGRMTREEFDSVLAAIAHYAADDEEPGPAQVPALLEEELITMAGGVQVADTGTGARIEPGCCFGLENWRDWRLLTEDEVPWLGHSPTPAVEFSAGVLRLWRDGERKEEPACDIPAADLPEHLEGVRQDLLGFLELVRRWAPDGLGERLAARFDQDFHISAPL